MEYRKNRENGNERDNPKRPFPANGTYQWINPRKGSHSKVQYNSSIEDQKWMEENDRNYLKRLAREKYTGELSSQEAQDLKQGTSIYPDMDYPRKLNLCDLRLNLDSIRSLAADLIQANCPITTINLSNTGLTDEVTRLLLEALKANPNSKLVDLDVRENAIRRSLIIRLRIQLQHNAARLSTAENIVNALIHSDDIQAEIRLVSPPEQQKPIPPIPEELEMLEVHQCASCNRIMINPVIAADGWTYESEEIERWFENHDTSPKTGEVLPHKHLIPNLATQREIARFMQAHPELWLTDEVYTSENLRQELIRAVQGQDAPTVERIVRQDRRLLTRILAEDRDLLLLALTSNPEVLQRVITELGEDKFWELPEIVRDDGVGCFRLAAMNLDTAELGTACARVMYTALGWQQREIQEQFEFAISSNNLRLAEVCLNLGANLEAINAQGLRPLHRVISANRYDLLRLFTTRAIEINSVETPEIPTMNTALHLAVIKRDQTAIEILLETRERTRLDLNLLNQQNFSALQLALCALPEQRECLTIARALINAGANLEFELPAAERDTVLLQTIRLNQPELFELAVTRAINPANKEARDNLGNTALHLAIKLASPEFNNATRNAFIVRLIELGPNLEALSEAGDTALLLAVRLGNIRLYEMILAQQVNPANKEAVRQGENCTPLHLAIRLGNRDLTARLLQAHANIEALLPPHNDTALLHAIRTNQPELLAP